MKHVFEKTFGDAAIRWQNYCRYGVKNETTFISSLKEQHLGANLKKSEKLPQTV